jgi:alkanesulfonate monooxygenase SsuD/methylene tetrahydromethanopterin reductase-like flavin-dependent oxidoreductase (luciferase family)
MRNDIKLALSVPNFAEPSELVDLGARAEQSGWDGFFLWDHVHTGPDMPFPASDPWVTLGAIATQTTRMRLGTSISAVARRRPQKLAREAVTVDHLSGGRMVLGVGLGEPPEEYASYGEEPDRRVVASKLDEALEVVDGLWSGEPYSHHGPHYHVEGAQYLPKPVQQPRIPIWAACVVPHTRPLRRAARWDGVMLASLGDGGSIDPVAPEQVHDVVETIAGQRADDSPFDVAVAHPGRPDAGELERLAAAGATWVMATGWTEQLHELVELAHAGAH